MTETDYPAIKFGTVRRGKSGGKRILFLHGFTGCTEDWLPIMERLEDCADFLAIDLPGHGRTITQDDRNYLFPGAAAAIIHFLSEIDFLPCHLVGYSMGGRLGLYLLLNHRQLFLDSVLESTSPGLKTERERMARCKADESLAAELDLSSQTHFLSNWYSQRLFEGMKRRKDEFDKLLQRRLIADKSGWVRSLRLMGTGQQAPLWGEMENLIQKVRLIVGADDSKFRAIGEEMAKHSSRLELSTIENSGHNVHFEQPVIFTDELKQFFDL